jgi:hypothetical protein
MKKVLYENVSTEKVTNKFNDGRLPIFLDSSNSKIKI